MYSVGNHEQSKRLLIHALKLWREWGDDPRVVRTLRYLSDVNRMLNLYEEGVEQAKEASEMFEWHNDTSRREVFVLQQLYLALLWYGDRRFDAAEEAAFRAINLLSDTGNQSINFGSVNVITSSATYIGPRARPRRPSTISRRPSESRHLSTGLITCFGSTTPWRGCLIFRTRQVQ